MLDQIGALNEATNAMIDRTGELLKQQTAMVQEGAVSSGVSVETLQHAFDNVFATMDAIDGYRAKAVETHGCDGRRARAAGRPVARATWTARTRETS